jgi:GDP-mannose 6-dehydrogenase
MSKISVFGLGYVGVVSACCLAKEGHIVFGVDPNKTKVDLVNNGNPPIIEQGIAELVQDAVVHGRLKATTDPKQAILESELSLICVGTPSQLNGSLDLKYVRHVCEEIGLALRQKQDFHIVVCRSTMLPGSMRNVVIPVLEESSGKKAGRDFGVCNNPEFLREGTAVHDFYNPPKIVIGETEDRSGDLLSAIYANLTAPMVRVDIETAEMIKYADNVWHALKVTFANEIGSICKASNIDGRKVMEIFCRDEKLNLSPYYLKPGFAFGGSCLPKDVRALIYKSRMLDLDLPVINAIMPSNFRQIEQGLKMILSKGKKKVGVLGFAFKAGTDDLRDSPMVEMIERLLGKGYDIRVYDRNVNLAKLVGANRDYILNHIPHISRLMTDSIEEVLRHSEILVIGNKADEFRKITGCLRKEQVVVDLVGCFDQRSQAGRYEGICW